MPRYLVWNTDDGRESERGIEAADPADAARLQAEYEYCRTGSDWGRTGDYMVEAVSGEQFAVTVTLDWVPEFYTGVAKGGSGSRPRHGRPMSRHVSLPVIPEFTQPEVIPADYSGKITVRVARAIAGSLGHPSKMPGYSYGISAERCQTGGKLRGVRGSV